MFTRAHTGQIQFFVSHCKIQGLSLAGHLKIQKMAVKSNSDKTYPMQKYGDSTVIIYISTTGCVADLHITEQFSSMKVCPLCVTFQLMNDLLNPIAHRKNYSHIHLLAAPSLFEYQLSGKNTYGAQHCIKVSHECSVCDLINISFVISSVIQFRAYETSPVQTKSSCRACRNQILLTTQVTQNFHI